MKADGSPGPNYVKSHQYSATDTVSYGISPGGKRLYVHVPSPFTNGAHSFSSDAKPSPFETVAAAQNYEPDLPDDYYKYLTTGATGLSEKEGDKVEENVVDKRIANYDSLPSGVFQLTSPTLTYDDYAGSPVHRFYQMWQQIDCSKKQQPTPENPSGCAGDLFPWVEVSIGTGSNGNPPPSPFTTREGGIAMEFYNMQAGDAPYLKSLADQYTLSDNMHQGVMGGTGANHIIFGYADAMWYSDGRGHPAKPPDNQIEDPNPAPNTNNWYTQDGYSGGSYTNCFDMTQPGVDPIVKYLKSLPRPIDPKCEEGHYYLLNNYNPGYAGTGDLDSRLLHVHHPAHVSAPHRRRTGGRRT